MTETKRTPELLPCPFCGNPPETEKSGADGSGLMIECIIPGCVGPHISYYDHATAIAKWNTRSSHDALVSALEGARQFIENGIELGYIQMPTGEDPAHETLPRINAALLAATGGRDK